MTITPPLSSAGKYVNFIAVIALALAAMSALAPAHAEVYRWVADNGTVNYGEREPRGRDFKVISSNGAVTQSSSKPIPAVASPGAVEPAANQNFSEKQQAMLDRMKADEAKRQENLAEIRKTNCDSSKRLLSKMQSNGRIRVRNENGEESAMSEQDRNEKIREAQQNIAANCESLS